MRILRDNEESGNNLEKHFRELRNQEAVPSPDLWDRLEYGLDEERDRVKHDHWYKALIMLLIPFTVINILITYDLNHNQNVVDLNKEPGFKQPYQSARSIIPNSLNGSGGWGNFFNGGFLPLNNSVKDASDNLNLVSDDHSDLVAIEPGNDKLEEKLQSDASTGLRAEPSSLLERKMMETSATAVDIMKVHSRKQLDDGRSAVKGFHVGIEGGLNNNWLLHKTNTLNPLIGNKIHRKFDLGGTYGISVGYDFSNRYGIEAEWIIQSQQGQEYWELKYGKILINGEVNLEYMHLPVMFKYKWTKMRSHSSLPRVLNLVTGIQYSRLRDAHVVQNGLDNDHVSQLFNRDELGVLLGVEYDIFVHRNYFFSMGMRASISTDARAFPYFNSEKTETYNLLIGVNASFNFLAKKRKKE